MCEGRYVRGVCEGRYVRGVCGGGDVWRWKCEGGGCGGGSVWVWDELGPVYILIRR